MNKVISFILLGVFAVTSNLVVGGEKPEKPTREARESAALEKAEKAGEKLNEVKDRPHTAKELGEAMKEYTDAKNELHEVQAEP